MRYTVNDQNMLALDIVEAVDNCNPTQEELLNTGSSEEDPKATQERAMKFPTKMTTTTLVESKIIIKLRLLI